MAKGHRSHAEDIIETLFWLEESAKKDLMLLLNT